MSALECNGLRPASGQAILLLALGALLGTAGCDRHGETARAILEAHSGSYAECERRKAELKKQIERQKREILALAAGDGSGGSAVDLEATQAMLKDLAACNADWASAVNRALGDAGVPDSVARRAVSEWLETRQLQSPDGASTKP